MEHGGHNGGGYFNASNAREAGFSVAIHADTTGTHSLTVRYANGGTTPRNGKVYVKGTRQGDVNLQTTNGWDIWRESTTNITLNAGENTLRLSASEEQGLANIDSIRINGDGLSLGTCDTQPAVTVDYMVGMDISSIPELRDFGSQFKDTDGTVKSILDIIKNHGVNTIRLRTFVEPWAQYGYASADGCTKKAEPYNDQAHLVEFAREIKAAGLALLVDIHYSDTWTDPSKQIIPQAWRHITTLSGLAEQVRTYTRNLVSALDQAGARPEMVQVGNESTPGMLVHIPTADSTCWGDNVVENSINGSSSNWDNLAVLLKAGIQGVNDVSASVACNGGWITPCNAT